MCEESQTIFLAIYLIERSAVSETMEDNTCDGSLAATNKGNSKTLICQLLTKLGNTENDPSFRQELITKSDKFDTNLQKLS